MMKAPLRILHLEDNSLDAELVKSAFQEEGITAEIFRVKTRCEFTSAIERGGYDAIFANHSLHGFDGLSALASAKGKCPDIPFFFITGHMGEELLIEALKSGATDYVLKNGIQRLIPSVRRALRETAERSERRKAVDALRRAYSDLSYANIELNDEIARRKQTERELVKVERALRTLSRSNAATAHASDEQTFANEICRIVVEEGRYLMAWIGYPQDNEEKRVSPYAYAGCEDGYLSTIKVTWEDNAWGRGPTGTAIRTGNMCVQNNRLGNAFMAPWRDEALRRGFASAIGLPLYTGGKCIGSLTIYASQTDIFIEEECMLLKELADNVAFAIMSRRMRENNRLAEEKIKESRDRLHDLAAHLQSVREEERSAIARDIHDEFGQMLMALKLNLSRTARESMNSDSLFGDKLTEAIEMINAIIQSVKKICTELRPSILDHLGLGSAIEWQAEEFQKRSGIECSVALDQENIDVNPEIAIALFRIFQESLTNVMKHAEATKVKATLIKRDNSIVLEIADNGIGITREQLAKTSSFGILGMQERVYPWKGSVVIVSSINQGTRIIVSIPAT
jgi:signal transduction histidine kinase/CheY-like chemotaxis protein